MTHIPHVLTTPMENSVPRAYPSAHLSRLPVPSLLSACPRRAPAGLTSRSSPCPRPQATHRRTLGPLGGQRRPRGARPVAPARHRPAGGVTGGRRFRSEGTAGGSVRGATCPARTAVVVHGVVVARDGHAPAGGRSAVSVLKWRGVRKRERVTRYGVPVFGK